MMTPGFLILALAIVTAVAFGLYRRSTDGSFDASPSSPETTETAESSTWTPITAALPDAELGERATFVQFSSAFCAPCRTTRVVLGDVADSHDGINHVEVDAEKHLDLVRTLDVRRTPTTLILDATGNEHARAAGAPRRDQVLAALPALRPADRKES